MIINDVIREATSEHEVYFLLTAYVEAVRFGDQLSCLPPQVRELPLHGVEDVRARIDGLNAALNGHATRGADNKSLVVARETAGVLGDALDRLQWLKHESRRAAGA
jgi:uncharacterized Zn-binding protein involved in type VI secretion